MSMMHNHNPRYISFMFQRALSPYSGTEKNQYDHKRWRSGDEFAFTFIYNRHASYAGCGHRSCKVCSEAGDGPGLNPVGVV